MDCQELAAAIFEAENSGRPIDLITARPGSFNVEDAYRVQLEGVGLKVAAGHKVVGMKIGFTSRAMQDLMNVREPDYGHLTDKMLLREGQACPVDRVIQPKVEGELAFCLKKPLRGPGVTIADVYEATAFVCPSIEVVDSRFKGWQITMLDSVADNGSASFFILGGRMTPIHEVDLRLVGMTLEKNGELINSGCGAEVLGHPAASVAWLANKLSEFGIVLEAGQIIMSGALTAALPAAAGDCFTASFTGLGSVTLRFA